MSGRTKYLIMTTTRPFLFLDAAIQTRAKLICQIVKGLTSAAKICHVLKVKVFQPQKLLTITIRSDIIPMYEWARDSFPCLPLKGGNMAPFFSTTAVGKIRSLETRHLSLGAYAR